MRIKITKGLILSAYSTSKDNLAEILFPAGEYLANLTPEGKIEVLNSEISRALFSFSQFREKISQGEFILIEQE
jgi:predicted enzyme involved in methoxymalonyl-ACP biosynthesis